LAEAGVELTIDDFDRNQQRTPLIAGSNRAGGLSPTISQSGGIQLVPSA